jgi:hypothetical protein
MVELLRRSRVARIVTAIAVCVAGIAAAIGMMSSRLTSFVESDRFRAALEKETAKGLHFENAHFSPIHRTGAFSAATDAFHADHGRKAMRALNAENVTATFNPWGIFQHRWQLDYLHVGAGEVEIQTYTPQPEPSPVKPWFQRVFLPERVYLKQVTSDSVDVTWQFRGQRAGFFQTRLLITPHDRDFDYIAKDGILKMRPAPHLRLRQTHVLITKTLLTLYYLDLQSEPPDIGKIHTEGHAGTGDDRSVNFRFDFDRLPVADWLPVSWRDHVRGAGSGHVLWHGDNAKLESSAGDGTLRVDGGQVAKLPFLQKLVTLSGDKRFEQLQLDDCSCTLTWAYPNTQIKAISVEEKGKFRIAGDVRIESRSLGGKLRIGVAPPYLQWLPRADEIFSIESGGYLWTTIHLSGTIDAPQQDLSPRLVALIEQSPSALLKLLFQQIGEWLKANTDKQ